MQYADALAQFDFFAQHAELELMMEYRDLLSSDAQSLERARQAGHFTASALMFDPQSREVNLLMHPKVGRWLQFGGHIESIDDSFAAAALRECQEESGYTEIALMDVPVQLDRHDVPCAGNQSVHWDIQFIALVNKAAAHSEGEDLQTRWWSVDTLGDELPDLDPSVRRLVAKALQITVS